MNNTVINKKNISNIIKVAIGNIIKLISGVTVGFLLPKIIGLSDYGYYKTFTLYAGYIGLFHFGIIDGILLKYGGKDYEQLDKKSFRFYTKFLFFLELFLSIIGMIVALLFVSNEIKFILFCISICLISINMTSYYQYISQITNRFNELSIRTIIQSLLNIIVIIVLFIVYKTSGNMINYRIYTLAYTLIQFILFIWYIVTYRDISFGKSLSFSNGKKNIIEFIKIGLPLLIANLCQNLILNVDRQFVNIAFSNDEYAIYAFAYNMLSLIMTATSAIAVVIYPSLKRTDENTLKTTYSNLITIILVLVSGCIIVYYPLVWFINMYLPNYINSLTIFRIILPGLIMSSAITIIMHNYYKVIGKNLIFFIISIIVLILSIFADLFAYFIFKATSALSIASVIVLFVWYIVTEFYFIKNFNVKFLKNFLYLIFVILFFYLSSAISYWWMGMIINVLSYLILTVLFNFSFLKNFIYRFKLNKKHKKLIDVEESDVNNIEERKKI